MASTMPLLDVQDLHVQFATRSGVARAVNGVSFSVQPGRCLAVLGESGSGKSVTAQAIMGIIDEPVGSVTGGRILYRGTDLLALPERERVQVRGAEIALIFQDALSALNSVYPVGRQISEAYRVRNGVSRKDAHKRALELMDLVRIPDAAARVSQYPHQFSGGMRQRIMIAMALALEPKLLIADEPTTALDVTVQAEIMELLAEIRAERNMAMMLITHDLGVVAENADDVVVMYAGRTVERGNVFDVFAAPKHPYTRGLLASMPDIDVVSQDLNAIPGAPPPLTDLPTGCSFHPRCPLATEVCRVQRPELIELDSRASACHHTTMLEGSLR